MSDPTLELVLSHLGVAKKEDKEPDYSPHPLAQAMELRERYARLTKTEQFMPGDIVRSKRGIGPFKENKRTVLIVLRKLYMNDIYDQMLVKEHMRNKSEVTHTLPLDIVLGDLMRGSGNMLTPGAYSSCLFELVTDEELSKWEVEATNT